MSLLKPVREIFQQLKTMSNFERAFRILGLLLSVCSAFMTWNFFKVLLHNDMPVVVVLTQSMEPGFERGDILTVKTTNLNADLNVGDIVVYQLHGRVVPIVHRLLERRVIIDDSFRPTARSHVPTKQDGFALYGKNAAARDNYSTPKLMFITKGDNNEVHDTFLYTTGKCYIEPYEAIGKVQAYLPGIGYLTIAMKEHSWVKYLMFAGMGIMAMMGIDS